MRTDGECGFCCLADSEVTFSINIIVGANNHRLIGERCAPREIYREQVARIKIRYNLPAGGQVNAGTDRVALGERERRIERVSAPGSDCAVDARSRQKAESTTRSAYN